MSKYEVILHAFVVQGLSFGAGAKRFNVSKTLAHKHHKRFLLEGRMDLEPRSRAPRRVPRKISPEIREQIQQLRRQVTTDGFDAGADTVVELLHREGITVSRSSVWRILHEQQLITAKPQKEPLIALSRIVADQPNELWQSDTTHWQLSNGREIEIIGWLDDHSRFLTHLSAHPVATGKTVTGPFLLAAKSHGFPSVYSAEKHPHSPTHSSPRHNPPRQTTPPDHPDLWRVRYGIVDEGGKVSLRYGNLVMHLGIGRAHHRTPVVVLVHGLDATTITHTGEVLTEHRINPKKIYQPKR